MGAALFEVIDAVCSSRARLNRSRFEVPQRVIGPCDDLPVQGHDNALSFDRPLVIGNRGMGKSFWAAVLSHEGPRRRAAEFYPRARLEGLRVVLGSHEAAGKQIGDIAPSQKEVAQIRQESASAEQIWQAVLLRALEGVGPVPHFSNLHDSIIAVRDNPLKYEDWLRQADAALKADGKRFLLLFDALDRLAREWSVIRDLSRELLRLALDLSGYQAIRAKIFMRSDQYGDPRLFDFQDASKIKIGAVWLEWKRADLYGLLFTLVWNNLGARDEFKGILAGVMGRKTFGEELPELLREDEQLQAKVFSAFAGPFMGTDRRRGRTYSWLHQHLADAFEQTSPRSFLLAVSRAASSRQMPNRTAIDYNGIKEG